MIISELDKLAKRATQRPEQNHSKIILGSFHQTITLPLDIYQ